MPGLTQSRSRKPLSPKGVATASLIGTTIEWYDFYVYGTSVVLVLGPLFFPSENALTGSLLAFSTIGVGFLARPVGGLVFSHFGDRFGRKDAMIVSLVMMGAATVAVGLLPTYTQIGLWAPVLLVTLRFVQGLAVGGEWGGAVLLSVEQAPEDKRSYYGTFPQFGSPLGLLSSSAVIALLQFMPDSLFLAWGWRIPFLLSAGLIVIGLFMRLRIEESPISSGAPAAAPARLPILSVLKDHWRVVLLGAGVCVISHGYFIIVSFLPAYAKSELGVSAGVAAWSLVLASIVAIVTMTILAPSLDSRDRLRYTIFGGVAGALIAFPAFVTTVHLGAVGLLLAVPLAYIFVQGQYAVLGSLLADLFPADVRYTGISLCYQLSAIVGGGLMPIVAGMLVAQAGGSWWPAAALMVVAGLTTAGSSLVVRPFLNAGELRDQVRPGSPADSDIPEPTQQSSSLAGGQESGHSLYEPPDVLR